MRKIGLAATAIVAMLALPALAQEMVGSDAIKQQLLSKQGGVNPGATRGIKKPPATQTAAAAQASDKPAVSLPVLFETGSADLTDAGRAQLDQLGTALQDAALAAAKFRIEGHTDTVGSDSSNRSLSERRAMAVADYLASKYGVERGRLVAVGMGKRGLAVATPDQTAEPQNRRVVVINLNG